MSKKLFVIQYDCIYRVSRTKVSPLIEILVGTLLRNSIKGVYFYGLYIKNLT